jgi:hypothetical protein
MGSLHLDGLWGLVSNAPRAALLKLKSKLKGIHDEQQLIPLLTAADSI